MPRQVISWQYMLASFLGPVLLTACAHAQDAVGTGRSADVPDLKAKADGQSDDAPAIQAALDRLAGQGGGTVRLPAGTYRLQPREGSSCGAFTGDGAGGKTQWALNVPDNVTLRGEGPKATVLRVAPEGFFAAINLRAKQARIEGIGIVSDARPPGISELWGILANRAERCVVEDCRFEQLSVGVLFTGAQECRASRCQARDCTGNGLLMYAANRCVFQDSIVDGCGDGNCAVYGACWDCHILGCTLLNANQNGVLESAVDCSIRDCTVDGGQTGYMGLIVNRSPRARIEGNTVRNVHHGIYVRETDVAGAGGMPCLGARVVNNTVTRIVNRNPGNPNMPIFVSFGYGARVSGNLLHDNDAPAEIVISGGGAPNYSQANCIVSDNTFVLTQAHYGDGFAAFFARAHPCVQANVGVTVSGNAITSYGAGAVVAGLGEYLIDVGPGSLVTGNRNGGLPGLAGGIDRFIRAGADSVVSDNLSSWHSRQGSVIAVGKNSIVRGNRLSGPPGEAQTDAIQADPKTCLLEGNLVSPR